MNMDIDKNKPIVTNITSTLTTTHLGVIRLEQEAKQQKVTINNMEQQIQNLQKSVQELVEYKAQKEAAKEKYNKWQQGITTQLGVVGTNAQETKEGKTKLEKNMIKMQQIMQALTRRLIQGGSSSQPHPVNLPLAM